jgi:Circularly permutated YpsA SLOG family
MIYHKPRRAFESPIYRRSRLAARLILKARAGKKLKDTEKVLAARQPTLSGGSKRTMEFARKHEKPCLHFCAADSAAADRLKAFTEEHRVTILNVAGPRVSNEPGVGEFVMRILDKAFGEMMRGFAAKSCSAASSCATAGPSFPITLPKLTRPKQPLTSHHVEYPNAFAVRAIKDPAGRLDNLPVSRTTELRWYGSALGVPFQLFDMFEDSLDKTPGGLGVVQSNVIRDRVQIS